ncbi:hypothetical protein CYMTET_6802 [Cymbomonas tetramitiformis]|uniref:Uncharacterized protein n=1 Tax=Cymbomonas tetramitiformis TaxID=36881 RepID=A0AAE0LI39_9CHLO|nr:hypothetical protein CYMTET_6802 [Cymbomonas tetramitiformis]
MRVKVDAAIVPCCEDLDGSAGELPGSASSSTARSSARSASRKHDVASTSLRASQRRTGDSPLGGGPPVKSVPRYTDMAFILSNIQGEHGNGRSASYDLEDRTPPKNSDRSGDVKGSSNSPTSPSYLGGSRQMQDRTVNINGWVVDEESGICAN